MIKILHAADLHLDSALTGHSEEATDWLRRELRALPEKILSLCKREKCDLMLLGGDLFDGKYTRESFLALKNALEEAAIPVFISPGNHDFCAPGSPWLSELWPENVHIFTRPQVKSVALPELDCRIYGAGFTAMDCPSLLDGFQTEGEEKYHIGLFHGDPTQSGSPYNPISQAQAAQTDLDYLALGHIHKTGSFFAGRTLCAWPGCPMGRGFDEPEEKGVLLVTLDEGATAEFRPLDTPRFYDWEVPVLIDGTTAIAQKLPAAGNRNFYRITLTGEWEKPELSELYRRFSNFPNLEIRDRTQPIVDIWGSAGADSLEGVYFRMLREALEEDDEESRQIVQLAAKISRKILDGSEVALP